MSRRSPSSPAPSSESPADRLQTSVDQLADNVRVVTDIVDQIREDLSWLTRNGIPHQPLTVLVHRMPLLSDSKPTAGTFEFSLLSSPVRDPTAETLSNDDIRAIAIDQIVSQLAEPLGRMAQEQLNTLLSVLDDSHRRILQAIREPHAVDPEPQQPKRRTKKALLPSATPTLPTAPALPSEPPPPKGKLF